VIASLVVSPAPSKIHPQNLRGPLGGGDVVPYQCPVVGAA
jgi:hypothetical protein